MYNSCVSILGEVKNPGPVSIYSDSTGWDDFWFSGTWRKQRLLYFDNDQRHGYDPEGTCWGRELSPRMSLER